MQGKAVFERTHCRISGMVVFTFTLKSSHRSLTRGSKGLLSWKVMKLLLDVLGGKEGGREEGGERGREGRGGEGEIHQWSSFVNLTH